MRYFNATSQPYVSDFVPQNLDLIYKMQQDMVNEDKAAALDLEKNKVAFNIQAGPGTQLAGQQLNQLYNTESNKIAAELASGKLSGRDAALRAKTLLYHFATNPEVKQVQKDAAYNEQVNKALADSQFQQMGIMDAYDRNTGKIKQLTGIVDDSELAQRYGVTLPGDTFKEHKDLFDAVKPQITKYYNDPNYETTVDESGNLRTYLIATGEEKEFKSRDQVKQALSEYILKDPNALNKPSLIYNKKRHELNFPGSKYNPQDALEDVANAFVGSYSTSKDIQQIKSAGKGSSKGSGPGSGSSSDDLPNDIYNMLENLEKSKDGSSSIDNYTAASVLGGTYDKKEGYSIIHVDSETPTFLATPRTLTGLNNDQENVELSKAIPYQIKINNLKNKAKEVLEDYSSQGKQYIDPNTKSQYYKDPSGIIHETDINGNKKKLTIDQFIITQEEYKAINESAKQNGININDPKYKKTLKTSSPEELESLNNIALAINSLEGEFKFNTDPNSKNVFRGDDGYPYIKGYVTLNEEELEELEGFDLSKAVDLGIVKKLPKQEKIGDIYVDQYKVPMIRRIEGNTKDMVSNHLLNKYGESEYTKKQIQRQQDQVLNKIQELDDKKEAKSIIKFYNTDLKGLLAEIKTNIETILQDNPDLINKFNQKQQEIILSNETSEKKAQALHLLQLNAAASTGDQEAVNKYNRFYEKYNSNDLGKQKEEWIQTPAKPLK